MLYLLHLSKCDISGNVSVVFYHYYYCIYLNVISSEMVDVNVQFLNDLSQCFPRWRMLRVLLSGKCIYIVLLMKTPLFYRRKEFFKLKEKPIHH